MGLRSGTFETCAIVEKDFFVTCTYTTFARGVKQI